MNKGIYTSKFWLVIGFSLWLVLSSQDAFAAGKKDRSHENRREVVEVGHHRYHYQDGRFYRPGFFGLWFFLADPPIGAVVTSLPFGHSTIIIQGATYYHHSNVYYKQCPSGYIVVPHPRVNTNIVYTPSVGQQQMQSGQTVVINVPNLNGSYTPVTLVKLNNGYIGPQGEFYPQHPTVEQLRALYGS